LLTKQEFIKNNREWAVQIGLSENGKAKMGVSEN